MLKKTKTHHNSINIPDDLINYISLNFLTFKEIYNLYIILHKLNDMLELSYVVNYKDLSKIIPIDKIEKSFNKYIKYKRFRNDNDLLQKLYSKVLINYHSYDIYDELNKYNKMMNKINYCLQNKKIKLEKGTVFIQQIDNIIYIYTYNVEHNNNQFVPLISININPHIDFRFNKNIDHNKDNYKDNKFKVYNDNIIIFQLQDYKTIDCETIIIYSQYTEYNKDTNQLNEYDTLLSFEFINDCDYFYLTLDKYSEYSMCNATVVHIQREIFMDY
jgi:hypothetical protein